MSRYPSVEVAIDALQAQNEALERELAERTAELAEARRGGDVEAALDRVWTRALAIQHSDETLGVAVAVFDALRELGLPVLQIILSGRTDPETGEAPVWTAGIDSDGAPRANHHATATAGHPVLDATFGAGTADGPTVDALDRAAYEAYLRASLARYPASYADRVVARAPRAETVHYVAVPAGARQSGPLVALLAQPPAPDAIRTLERFAVLFGLAYARHQDLQQAETQARTSRIDAAVERVRARALAMRRSGDLGGVVGLVFEGLRGLGVPFHRCTVAVVEPETRRTTYWSSAAPGEAATTGIAVLDGHPFYDALWVAWRRQRDLSYILEDDELRTYYDRLRHVQETLLAAHETAGDREYVHAITFAAGVLVAYSSRPFSEDTVQTMQRMAEAFAFAHARHLDLQEAEARARETAQAASVDRVRAEIASMRDVADLDRVTPLIWQELTELGVRFFRCAILIVDDEAQAVRVYLAAPEGDPLASLDLPFGGHPFVGRIVTHWRSQEVLSEVWDAEAVNGWTQFLEEHGLDPHTARSFADPTEPLALHFAPFAQGLLFVGSAHPLPPEDGAAVQALADAFEVAYARYDDFQRLDVRAREVEAALAELRAAQQRLVQSEKLASLGALTAGIAHEIKNPLNFVNNFAALSRELADELADELRGDPDPELVQELLDDLQSNAARIEQHGRRADAIVLGMMQHARGGEGQRVPVDLNRLVEEHVNLAYHGRRAQTPDFNVTLERDYDDGVGEAEVMAQEIGRVLINLVTNAFDAVMARAAIEGGDFEPTVRVATARVPGGIEVRVEDNGTGIPKAVLARVFEPFYTTKPAGRGTGLGLSMSHDIVEQGHGGTLRVESAEGEGTTFVVTLPG